MSVTMLTQVGWARFVLALVVFAGCAASAFAQEDQSGAGAGLSPGEAARVPAGLDDAFVPVDANTQRGRDLVDVRDTAMAPAPPATLLTLADKLAGLDRAERANAVVEVELGGSAGSAERDAAVQIAALWNAGNWDAAVAALRTLEAAGTPVAVGIAWRVPVTGGGQRMLDVRVGGTNSEAQAMNLDFDAQTGHVFAVARWGSTTGASEWTANMSMDGGVTWAETYTYTSSVGLIDVDCVVADDYLYIAYVAGNAPDEARLRRCLVSTGNIDNGFGFHVVFDAGADTVEEVALASNANDYDNRIYYAVIQSNDELRFAYDAADDGTTFVETSPAGASPEYGLDMTWDNHRTECSAYLYVSYAGSDGSIHVLGRDESNWTNWVVETGAGSFRTTAISAYEETILCAFEYPYAAGTGIRYRISYDCGTTWHAGAIAVPDGSSVFGYFEPDVDARDGDGTAIAYQAEAGEYDPMYYRTREGFGPGAWSDPSLFNDYDVYTGSDTALAYLPALGTESFSHGALYLSLDPDFRTPYFDRPQAGDTACGDATPPVVSISSPVALSCACTLVDITGAVGDSDGTYVGDRLEVRRQGTSAWVTADTALGERSGVLYTWDTSGLAEDFYFARIVAENECGLTASDCTFAYVSTSFDDLELQASLAGGVYGGMLSVHGTASTQSCFEEYAVSYRPVGGGIWIPVDPLNPVYSTPVINDSLAVWDTVALGLADGDFELRLLGETHCGDTDDVTITVTIDNTLPVARLDAPANGAIVPPGASVAIHGEASDANLAAWTLAVTGGPYTDWHTIAGPSSSNVSGLLLSWDTAGLPAGAYTLRLQATDTSTVNGLPTGHVAADYASIIVGDFATPDLDGDGDVDMDDFVQFHLAFTGPLP